jgi:methionine synthase II (cobalamin-independent)
VDYHKLLPSLFKINAGYFLIQLSSEKNREAVYESIGQHIRKDANGVKQVFFRSSSPLLCGNSTNGFCAEWTNFQVAFIGVINTLNPAVETPEQVADQLVLASKYIPVDQLGATDDCGMPPSILPPLHQNSLVRPMSANMS